MFYRKAKVFIVYLVLYHLLKQVLDILLPNFHHANLVRGYVLGCFFKKRGKRLAIASGVVVNCPWNVVVGDDVYFAHRCWLNGAGGLIVGDGSIFSPNVVVATTAHDRMGGRVCLNRSKVSKIEIGSGVWIASNSVVTKGARIGDGVIVSACSVVRGHLDENWLYSGNPAVKVKELNAQD